MEKVDGRTFLYTHTLQAVPKHALMGHWQREVFLIGKRNMVKKKIISSSCSGKVLKGSTFPNLKWDGNIL